MGLMRSLRDRGWRVKALLCGAVLVVCGLGIALPRYELQNVGTAVMSPAIAPGETTLVDTFHAASGLKRGDIVAVRHGWSDSGGLVVRLIGIGGDTVVCDSQGKLSVNGAVVAEPYAHGDNGTFGPFSVTVPASRIFVLGDARSISVDSRSHLAADAGTLPVSEVSGRIAAVMLPAWNARMLGRSDPLLCSAAGCLVLGAGLVLAASWRALSRRASAVSQWLRSIKFRSPRTGVGTSSE